MNLKARLRKSLSTRSRSKVIPTGSDADFFCHSEPLSNVHHRPSEAFTILPRRLHRQDALAVESATFFHAEIKSAMSQPAIGPPCLLSSSIGHCSSLLYPECLPERLDAVAMILEAGAFHDDITEEDELGHAVDHHNMVTSIFGVNGQRSEQGQKGEKYVTRMASGFIAKYGEEGKILMDRVSENWLRPMDLEFKDNPTSFEDSVSQRIVNAGTGVAWGILEFSLGISLSQQERKQIDHIVKVADRIFANTNDYFSWEVERESTDRASNSIRVLIEIDGLSEQQAKEKLKNEILKDEENYQRLSKRILHSSSNTPARAKRFLAMLEVLLGGHHLWCASCDRYKARKSPSEKEMNARTGEEKSEKTDLDSSSSSNLDDTALLDPVNYIRSLPSKNMRSKVIDAFNVWLKIPEEAADMVKATIGELHQSTLILDDMQDSSPLRRGFAATHQVFSPAECINSATYMVAKAASIVAWHSDKPDLIRILLAGLKDLALGQSWDLNWKATGHFPSVAEYMAMVDGKTGAMFEMTIRMMDQFSSGGQWPISKFIELSKILGRWYQIRDDYQNLQDEQYTSQKGFCEDLDEGKLSYPLVVCCSKDPVAQRIIMGIFRQKPAGTPLEVPVKMQILDLFRRTGALQHTWDVLQELQNKAEVALSDLERVIGEENSKFRAIASLLGNIPPPSPGGK